MSEHVPAVFTGPWVHLSPTQIGVRIELTQGGQSERPSKASSYWQRHLTDCEASAVSPSSLTKP